MSLNVLHEVDRIKQGKIKEDQILGLLNELDWEVNGEKVKVVEPATLEQDLHDKVDAFAVCDSDRWSVQIKFRDTGQDLGVACVRPWKSHKLLKEQWKADKVPWDRDMKSPVDLYVCLNDNRLVIASGSEIKKICTDLLDKLVEDKIGFASGNTFPRKGGEGAELKRIYDKGQGYSGGQGKIICYITFDLLESSECTSVIDL